MKNASKIFLGLIAALVLVPYSASSYCGQAGECGCGDRVLNDTVLNSSIDACRGKGLEIDADDVTLNCRGHRITGNTNRSSGIIAEDVQNVTVKNCRVSNYYSGIQFHNVSNSLLLNNSASSNYATGIELVNSSDNLLTENQANGNWDGIYLEDSSDNRIINNSAHRNKIDGLHLFYGSYNNTVRGNNLTRNKGHGLAPAVCDNRIGKNNTVGLGKPIKYVQNKENIIVEDTSRYSEIIFCNVNNSVIRNVSIINGPLNTDGIILVNSDHNKIVNSYFEDVRTGIYLFRSSSSNKVLNNTVISSDLGIRLRYGSNDNLVAGNTIKNTEVYLKAVKNSTGNKFRYNVIEGQNISLNYSQDLELRYSSGGLNFTESGQVLTSEEEGSGLLPVLMLLLVLAVLPLIYFYIKRSDFGVFSY
ncbi:MAG: nitrous oxide reductase family maturation protein NosD [Candidatus Nanohalobium sp.]